MPPRFRLKPVVIAEADVLDECRRTLLSHPFVAGVLRINGGGSSLGGAWVWFYSLWIRVKRKPLNRGMTDLLVFLKGGRIVLIEGKRAGADLSPEQRYVHAWARDNRIPVFVVDRPSAIGPLLEDLSR